MKKLSITFLAVLLSVAAVAATKSKTISVKSPNGQTEVKVTVGGDIRYDVISNGETLMAGNKVAMRLGDRTLGENPAIKSSKITAVSGTVKPAFKLKFAEVENNYSLLALTLKGNYQILWRVYDDGVAYRIVTSLPGEIDVMEESVEYNFVGAETLIGQLAGRFKTSHEEAYSCVKVSELNPDRMWEVPFVAQYANQKAFVCEFDVEDYPGLFLKPSGSATLAACHPHSPLKFEDQGDRSVRFIEESEWIAHTAGTRAFPWRYILITQDDRKIAENRMPMRLAPESRIDTEWISRGQTTWDWLNGIPYGPGIDFVGGINLETYKYFTDFAERNGVKYILIDEGWALDTRNPYVTNPEVKIHELISYARERGIGVILWLPWLTVEHNMDDMFKTFAEWGIKGVKIDFMDRQDQWMINYYERVAIEAAKNHIFVDFHGANHPTGLEYRYPNVLTYEGVRGIEYRHDCLPDNTVFQPYLRNAAGPMDFTPGMVVCQQPEFYKGDRPVTPAVGTKVSQMAQIVAFETGLQMLADNPCRYEMYPECRDFMCGVPVEWDDTKVLAGELGQYYIVAKRSGDTWYIAGINNSAARDVTIDLSFLRGREYDLTAFIDGPLADKIGMDYRCIKKEGVSVGSVGSITVHMARNGGIAAVLE